MKAEKSDKYGVLTGYTLKDVNETMMGSLPQNRNLKTLASLVADAWEVFVL